MKKRYSVGELCAKELNNISVNTFSRHKEKYMNKLKEKYFVTTEKGERGKIFYILEPKPYVLYDNVSQKASENIDSILKALIVDKVIPVNKEIIAVTGFSDSKVKRTIKLMKDNGIIHEPHVETRFDVDENGEIFHSWEQKLCSYTYYDYFDGTREKIENPTVHQYYGKFFGRKLKKLKHELKQNFDIAIGVEVAHVTALKELTSYFNANSIRREPNYRIENKYVNAIKQKYGHN